MSILNIYQIIYIVTQTLVSYVDIFSNTTIVFLANHQVTSVLPLKVSIR